MSNQPPLSPAEQAAVRLVTANFHALHYIRHNARRLEHLASLRLPIDGATVLEVGAGIGDHTTFYLDRGCTVTSVEARPENCAVFAQHMRAMPGYQEECDRLTLIEGDAQFLAAVIDGTFDVVHCYGLLYHLQDPESALAVMASAAKRLLLLELCVSYGSGESVNPTPEAAESPTQAFHGVGCRPTRPWVWGRLKKLFPFVYAPATQPAHREFPLDWTAPPRDPHALTRAVFVASREKLSDPLLLDHLPDKHTR